MLVRFHIGSHFSGRGYSISQDQNVYAEKVLSVLKVAGIRAENWNEAESMQNRIRKAEQMKIPYMLVVGKRGRTGDSCCPSKRNKNEGEDCGRMD